MPTFTASVEAGKMIVWKSYCSPWAKEYNSDQRVILWFSSFIWFFTWMVGPFEAWFPSVLCTITFFLFLFSKCFCLLVYQNLEENRYICKPGTPINEGTSLIRGIFFMRRGCLAPQRHQRHRLEWSLQREQPCHLSWGLARYLVICRGRTTERETCLFHRDQMLGSQPVSLQHLDTWFCAPFISLHFHKPLSQLWSGSTAPGPLERTKAEKRKTALLFWGSLPARSLRFSIKWEIPLCEVTRSQCPREHCYAEPHVLLRRVLEV